VKATNLFHFQTFSPTDLVIIFIIFIVEIFLSADNILAISLILDKLEEKKRKISLLFGIWSSLVFRAIIIIFASYLILLNSLKVIGGAYLIYLSISHRLYNKKKLEGNFKPISLLKGIISIELTDILFALDSIFITLSLLSFFYSGLEVENKIWVVYVGGILGVIALRMSANKLLRFLKKYPLIEKCTYNLIGWIGVKLIFIGFSLPPLIPHFDTLFNIGVLLIIMLSFFSTKWTDRR
jgi:YkoY family integral membrane protein